MPSCRRAWLVARLDSARARFAAAAARFASVAARSDARRAVLESLVSKGNDTVVVDVEAGWAAARVPLSRELSAWATP